MHRHCAHISRLILAASLLGAFLSLVPIYPVFGKPKAIFSVTNLNNSGPNSLRWAINQANTSDGPDLIDIQVNGVSSRLSIDSSNA